MIRPKTFQPISRINQIFREEDMFRKTKLITHKKKSPENNLPHKKTRKIKTK